MRKYFLLTRKLFKSGLGGFVGGGKKKKTGLIAGGLVAAVAVIAAAAVTVTGLFANPKGQVEKAMAKSAAAYAAAKPISFQDMHFRADIGKV